MATDGNPLAAGSSPTEILKALTPEQYKVWQRTGDLPEVAPKTPAKTEETKAASSPAANTAVTEPPAKAAETVADPVPVKEEPKAKGAEARIKELLADNKKLASELEALRKPPAIALVKSEEPAKPLRNEVDSKTGQLKFATDDAFDSAYEKWMTDKVSHDVRKQIAKENEAVRVAEQNKIIEQRMLNSIKITKEKHPDFETVLEMDEKGQMQAQAVKSIKQNGVLDAWILDSELGMEILYHLAKNPSEIERIQALNPFAAARELTKLEDKLSVSTPASPKPEEKASSAPNVTKAPAPAANISGKATAPVDEEEAAVKAQDFLRFEKVANEEDFRRRKAS